MNEFQSVTRYLNQKYNFLSSKNSLESDQDSVNFDEIVAVSPAPNGNKPESRSKHILAHF